MCWRLVWILLGSLSSVTPQLAGFALRIELTALGHTLRFLWPALAIAIPLFGSSANTPAADLSRSQSGANALPGLASPPGDLDRESKPVDVDAQLREIENTKKLMKALGELHGQGTGGVQSQLPSQAGSDPGKSAPAVSAAPVASGGRDLKGLELPGLPTDDLRALGKEAAQAARAAGLGSGSGGAEASPRLADASPGESGAMRPARAPAPGDEERYRVMLESLIEEIGPWVIAFVVVFFLGYVAISWLSARARKSSRPGDRARSGSRRRGESRRRSGAGAHYQGLDSTDRVSHRARNSG